MTTWNTEGTDSCERPQRQQIMKMWACPGIDTLFMPECVYTEDISILEKKESLDTAIQKWKKAEGKDEITLPFVQNIEAAILGCGIKKRTNYWSVGDYCLESLDETRQLSFDLLSDKKIQVLLEWISEHPEENVIVEVEAPFSILSALINPMTLYDAMITAPQQLKEILEKLTVMQENYIKALIKAGCSVLSLADPAGTIDLIGLEMYRKFSGSAITELIKKSMPSLQNGLLHLCGKLSHSLLLAQMADTTTYPIPKGENYHALLFQLAKKENIRCIGQNCMHTTVLESPCVCILHI